MMFESKKSQNEKKEKRKAVLQFDKTCFLYCSFLAGLLAFHFKDDL
jgi:hypothetical protein